MGTPTPPAAQTVECFLGHRLEKDHYHVQRVRFDDPARGIARQTVQCAICGKRVRLMLVSRKRAFGAFRVLFIIFGLFFGLLPALVGVALLMGSSDSPPNLGGGVALILVGCVIAGGIGALGFVITGFMSRREKRSGKRATMPAIRDSIFRVIMAVLFGRWLLDLRHRLLAIQATGANFSSLLPSERGRGARWVGDLMRNRVMSIEE